MTDWLLVQRLDAADGGQMLEIRRSPEEQLFRYHHLTWIAAAPEDEGALGDGYWSVTEMSGYFGTAEECEAAARQAFPDISAPQPQGDMDGSP